MPSNKIALCLSNQSNDYQANMASDAASAAQRNGFSLEVYDAEERVTQQIRQMYEILHAEPARRPAAIIIMPVRAPSLERVAHEAAANGIGWVCLHRRMQSLSGLRREFPELPISIITPNHREVGEIQGRQFRALLPDGGQVLYVTGEATSSPAQDRQSGMNEALKGSAIKIAGVLDGGWTTSDAERVIGNWLRIVMSGSSKLHLIGCQSDAMAVGAVKALNSVAEYLRRPELALTPVTGCDGVPNVGQKLVRQGQLAATVIIPSSGGPAVEVIARAINRGEHAAAEVLLSPTSFPPEATLAQQSSRPK